MQIVLKPIGKEIVYQYNQNEKAVSASTIKLLIAITACGRVCTGKWCMNTMLTVSEKDILPDSDVFATGARSAKLEELITWMLILSDNTSTNVLIDALGIKEINETAQKCGLKATSLGRKMLDFDAVTRGINNYTSAFDMAKLFEALYTCSVLTQPLCGLLINILKRQRFNQGLPRYIWEQTEIAHKTGSLDYLSHDVGVVEMQNKFYVLAVFISNAANIDGDLKLCARISRIAYDYMEALPT